MKLAFGLVTCLFVLSFSSSDLIASNPPASNLTSKGITSSSLKEGSLTKIQYSKINQKQRWRAETFPESRLKTLKESPSAGSESSELNHTYAPPSLKTSSPNQKSQEIRLQKETTLPKKVGTLTAKVNGQQYSGDLFEEGKPYSYRITSGNKNYEIRFEWKYVNSPANIREDIVDLSERNNDLSAEYINFNVPDKYIISSGLVIIKNDGKKVNGTFSIVASVDGYSQNNNSVMQLSDGTFEINYTK